MSMNQATVMFQHQVNLCLPVLVIYSMYIFHAMSVILGVFKE